MPRCCVFERLPQRPPTKAALRPRDLALCLGLRLRLGLGLGLGLALGLQACQAPKFIQRRTLIVYDVPPDSATLSKATIRSAWDPLLRTYKRLQPNVHINLNIIIFQEQQLKQELRRRNGRGLGPDLLIVNASTAVDLLNEGLTSKVQVPASVQNSLLPWVRSRVAVKGGLTALPVAIEPQLSCYNRTRIPTPPASLKELMALAAKGRQIGLSIFPQSIWWTTGSLGANQALKQLLESPASPLEPIDASERSKITAWLAWLADASHQSHVNFFNNDEDLLNGLGNGQLDWISCLSFNLPRLKQLMGNNLGVASLPAGPNGPASPNSLLRVLAFGINSSPQMRQLALDIGNLQLNPLAQRTQTLNSQQTLPVNRYATPPVSSSSRLQALVNAQEQFQQSYLDVGSAMAINRIEKHTSELESLFTKLVVDVIKPEQASKQLINILRKP